MLPKPFWELAVGGWELSGLYQPPRAALLPFLAWSRKPAAPLGHRRELHPFHPLHRRQATLPDHLQHAFHLVELLQQTIDVLDRGAAATGVPLAAAAIDDLVVFPFRRRHRSRF